MEREFYGEYLRWFHAHAIDGHEPLNMSDLFHTFLFSQTAYECESYVLDEAYFITWILPKASKTGRTAWFLFKQIDMLLTESDGDVWDSAVQTTYMCIAQI